MRILSISIILFVCLISCDQTDNKLNYVNSSAVAFNLISSCVDSALKVHKENNTNNYVVDLSAIQNINQAGQDSFTRFKASLLPTTHQDSTIIFDDSLWKTFHMAQSMIIKFDSIQPQRDGIVRVKMRKFRSSEKIITLELALKRRKNGYSFINVEETN